MKSEGPPLRYSEKQLKTNIFSQKIGDETIHYSLGEKDRALFSILFSNSRVIIFNEKQAILYYVNYIPEEMVIPFKKIPAPKNDIAYVKQSIVLQPTNTSQLKLDYVAQDQKGNKVVREWLFTFFAPRMAKEWFEIINNYKKKIFSEAIGIATDGKHGDQLSVVQNTLGFSMMPKLSGTNQLNKESQSPVDELKNESKKEPQVQMLEGSQVDAAQTIPFHIPDNSQISKKGTTSRIDQTQQNRKEQEQEQRQAQRLKQQQQQTQKLKQQQQQQTQRLKQQQQREEAARLKKQEEERQTQQLKLQQQKVKRESLIKKRKEQEMRESSAKRASNLSDDWNYKFYSNQTSQVVKAFEEACLNSFYRILPEDREAMRNPERQYKDSGLSLKVANAFTDQSRDLKREFRNYHFILDACKDTRIVGVSLTCLIEFEGVVALIKAPLPAEARKLELNANGLKAVKDLEKYTRILNDILRKAVLYDLTEVFGASSPLIYVDELKKYLPINSLEGMDGCSFRREYILEQVDSYIIGGEKDSSTPEKQQSFGNLHAKLNQGVKALADELSKEDCFFGSYPEIKNFFHSRGINMKYLARVYSLMANRNLAKYLQTAMVASTVKDYIIKNVSLVRERQRDFPLKKVVENSYRLLLEGNSRASTEFWKEITVLFKKQHHITMSSHEIVSGFLLNCLMGLIPAEYDLTQLDKTKQIFQDQVIIQKGFVVELRPKVKTYYLVRSDQIDTLALFLKQDTRTKKQYTQLIQDLQLDRKEVPKEILDSPQLKAELVHFLSFFTPPSSLESSTDLAHVNVYQHLQKEPPTRYSCKIANNALRWCLQKEDFEEFNSLLQPAVQIVEFWYDSSNPFWTELLDLQSEMQSRLGNAHNSINFMKEALRSCIRWSGTHSNSTAKKYYALADLEMRDARTEEALENFHKAKSNMESNNDLRGKYSRTLMKMGLLYLNADQVDHSIAYSLNSIKTFEDLQTKETKHSKYHGQELKCFQILSRAYEISERRSELRDLAMLCGKKFNKTASPAVYQDMVKIVLAGVIFKSSCQKNQYLLKLITKFAAEGNSTNQSESVKDLMALSEDHVPMETLINGYEDIAKYSADYTSKRMQRNHDFIGVLRSVAGAVGRSYIKGLIHQRESS